MPNFNQNEFNKLRVRSSKNKILLISFFAALVAAAFYGGYALSKKIVGTVSEKNAESLINAVDTESADIVSGEASVLNIFEAGKGEVKFVVSADTATVLRELFVRNPFKNSWILVYDGYRELSSEPQEIIRVNLASMTYDEIRARTLDNDIAIQKSIEAKEGRSVTVTLEL